MLFSVKTTPLVCAVALAAACVCPAQAQQPTALPGAPSAPAVVVPAPQTPAAVLPAEWALGRRYEVRLQDGTTFRGTLTALSPEKLEFDTPAQGHLVVQRADVQSSRDADAADGRKPGYFDIGNGTRLFFAPTARGLRRGEGTLHTVNLLLVGGNYGISDRLSVGGYLSLIPGLRLDEQLVLLTPKFSTPLADNLHAAVGLLYVNVPFSGNSSGGAGIVYGALTRGSADHNLTLGLGYGFFRGRIGSTPVLQLGGQTRVSRRLALLTENYIVADRRAGMAGFYGAKINWTRTSLGLGAYYVYSFPYTETVSNGPGMPATTYRYGGDFYSSYLLPLYYDFTYRFGKSSR